MSTTQSKRRSAKRVATKAEEPVAPTMPPEAPLTEEELAHEKAQIERLNEVIRLLRQRNLDNGYCWHSRRPPAGDRWWSTSGNLAGGSVTRLTHRRHGPSCG